MFDTKPLSPAGGVEVLGTKLSAPMSAAEKEALVALFNAHGLLLFRDQSMSKPALVAAASIFGEPEIHPLGLNSDREVPQVAVVSTKGRDGTVTARSDDELVGKIEWHTDQAYVPAPNRATIMWAVELPPEGGMTGFVDRERVYDALPERLKERIENLTVIQSWRKAQENIARNPNFSTDEGRKMLEEDRFPDLGYALVQRHPVTGRKVLHAPPMWSSGILDLPVDEGAALLEQLTEFSLKPDFVHWHSYKPGEVIIWDNWRFMHAASGTKGKYSRLMYRVVLKGGPVLGVPLESQQNNARQQTVSAANT